MGWPLDSEQDSCCKGLASDPGFGLCTTGMQALRERHAEALRRWSLRKGLFLLAFAY